MDKTEQKTTKQTIRARLLAEHAQAAREREAREKRNITHLVAFAAAEARIEEVDGWLAGRIDKATREAEDRRARHREAAAKAVRALAEDETVASIAAKTGASRAKVNEYLALGANAGGEDGKVAHESTAAEEPADNSSREGTARLDKDNVDSIDTIDSIGLGNAEERADHVRVIAEATATS